MTSKELDLGFFLSLNHCVFTLMSERIGSIRVPMSVMNLLSIDLLNYIFDGFPPKHVISGIRGGCQVDYHQNQEKSPVKSWKSL